MQIEVTRTPDLDKIGHTMFYLKKSLKG